MTRVTTRYGIALLLIGACAMASARDVQMHGANGDGGSCPEISAAKAKAEDKSALPESIERTPAMAPAGRGTPATTRESTGSGNRMQAPRWHSFLPGMFR
jgi:hypothetical protein